MNTSAIIVEQLMRVAAARVWEAITDRNEMNLWYFKIAAFEPVIGCEFEFEGGSETRTYLHKCRITEIIPQKRISYTWRYEGYSGLSTVSFDLIPKGDATLVRLTHEGVETFP